MLKIGFCKVLVDDRSIHCLSTVAIMYCSWPFSRLLQSINSWIHMYEHPLKDHSGEFAHYSLILGKM
jgi:hypothetical protein